jgi:hypothetical protein
MEVVVVVVAGQLSEERRKEQCKDRVGAVLRKESVFTM